MHIISAFVDSDYASAPARCGEALGNVGGAVFRGGVTSVAAAVSLLLAETELVRM